MARYRETGNETSGFIIIWICFWIIIMYWLVNFVSSFILCVLSVYLPYQDSKVPYSTVQYEDCTRRSVFIGTQQYNWSYVTFCRQTVMTSLYAGSVRAIGNVFCLLVSTEICLYIYVYIYTLHLNTINSIKRLLLYNLISPGIWFWIPFYSSFSWISSDHPDESHDSNAVRPYILYIVHL